MRPRLTFPMVLSFLALAAGCSARADDAAAAAAASESALRNENDIAIREQPPLDVRLGQAVAAEPAPFGWSDGTLLDARCVDGRVHSSLDTAKSAGLTAVAFTALAQAGMAPDGTVALVPVPAAGSPFYTSPHSGNGFMEPTMRLSEVAAFHDALAPSPTRLSGFAEMRLEHNAFSLIDEHQLPGNADCASRYVRGLKSKRFFLYGFRIDFAAELDVTEFRTRFNGGINLLFDANPAVQQYLVEHGAKVSTEVLVSTGLRGWAETQLAGQSCDASNLAACKSSNRALAAMLDGVASVPGNDDTLAALQAEGSTWGAYELEISTYDHVLP